ncbi:alpha/beta hydrolase [Leucobacter sp. USHLN153]|uniref:alpha/beta hydrolase n=1 Tax=Leucobacter sp. USHLN153 TaxID=3081268 RepID=UPI003018DCEB
MTEGKVRTPATRLSRRAEAAANDAAVAAISRGASVAFRLIGDSFDVGLRVDSGEVSLSKDSHGLDCDFTLTAADDVWEGLTDDEPPAGEHSVVTLVRQGLVKLSGEQLAYDRHVQIVRAFVDAIREARSTAPLGRPLTATGSYHRIETSLGVTDVYVERQGSGPQLLACATAGSQTSQWHGIMTHTDLTDRYELITVDLPWHGRTSPAWDQPVGSYRLTPDRYTEFLVAVADALELEAPILVGVSMGGAAVVHAIATHPKRFAGAVGCQAGPSVTARANEHLRGTRVNPALFIPEWTYGLMNPASPEPFKQRVWWGYSSGGHGLYAADIDSYLSWNVDSVQTKLTPELPHIAILSGVFDTSVPSSASEELARRIPNASFRTMPELGHFPHAENPPIFARHLEAALERVQAGAEGGSL